MEVLLEKSSPTLASLKVTLKKEDYQPKVDKAIKDYSKKVNLKGFRQGKVPFDVINRMYGKSILVDEVNHLLSHTVSDYIRDNKLQVVGDPVPNREKSEDINWDKATDFEFEYNLGLASDFEVDLSQIPTVTAYQILAGEKELEESIENLRERFADTEHPEVSEDGDIVYGELKQDSTEFSTKTAIPTKQLKDEAKAQFIGVKKGDTLVFDIQNTFIDEAGVAHVTGKKKTEVSDLSGDYTFVVEDISRTAGAALGQEFFDKVLGPGQVESEEQFREKLLEIIQSNYKREGEAKQRLDIEAALLENIAISVPKEFLVDWLERINEGKFTREKIEEDYPQFEKQLKMSLIRNRVADAFGVKVEQEEILEFTRGMVREQFGIYGSDDNMSETIDRIAAGYLNDREKDNYSTIFNQVFDNKVYQVLKEQVQSDSKEVEVAEFEKIVKGE